MIPIKFEFINKEIQLIHPTLKYKGSGLPYQTFISFRIGDIKIGETDEESIERVWKKINEKGSSLVSKSFKELSESEFKNCLKIIEFPQPKSFPKFSNEKKFTAFDRKYINPEILNIRWHGPSQTWEYRLRNIGHVFDYYEEKYLKDYDTERN